MPSKITPSKTWSFWQLSMRYYIGACSWQDPHMISSSTWTMQTYKLGLNPKKLAAMSRDWYRPWKNSPSNSNTYQVNLMDGPILYHKERTMIKGMKIMKTSQFFQNVFSSEPFKHYRPKTNTP